MFVTEVDRRDAAQVHFYTGGRIKLAQHKTLVLPAQVRQKMMQVQDEEKQKQAAGADQ